MKIGDEVRVVRNTTYYSGYDAGVIGCIKSISGDNCKVIGIKGESFEIDFPYFFYLKDLELVTPQPKFKKGDRVEYAGKSLMEVKTGDIARVTPLQIYVLFDDGKLVPFQIGHGENFNFRLIDHEYKTPHGYKVGEWVEVVGKRFVNQRLEIGNTVKVFNISTTPIETLYCCALLDFSTPTWLRSQDIKPLPAGGMVKSSSMHNFAPIHLDIIKKQTKSKGFKMAYFKVKDFLGIGADKKAVMETILTDDGQLNTCSPVLVQFFLEEFGTNLKLIKLAKAEMAKRKGETRCQ